MAVRRLHSDQPATFAFTAENEAWVEATLKKYPPGKQASAVIPLLMRAQEQHQGWLPEPAIRKVADKLGMAYIRVYEIATFYTQFQLAPVGKKAHVQVCGTTPCMLRGAEGLKEVCRKRIHHDQFHLSDDGNFSWEEVECAGACANAPMVQIFADTYEDLTPALLEKVLDGYAKGQKPQPGSQTGRKASAPLGGASTLKDPSLYDGSAVGAWRKRFDEAEAVAKAAAATTAAATAAAIASAPAGSSAGAACSCRQRGNSSSGCDGSRFKHCRQADCSGSSGQCDKCHRRCGSDRSRELTRHGRQGSAERALDHDQRAGPGRRRCSSGSCGCRQRRNQASQRRPWRQAGHADCTTRRPGR
jgi:NADH-quinone oxidoreductase subunit E